MFFKVTFFSTTLLIGIITSAYHFLCEQNEEDLIEYKRLIRESVDFRSKTAIEKEPICQLRTNVQKDIWSYNNDQRLHYRLMSEKSDLIIIQKKGKVEAIEKLKNIECCLQEELNESSEEVRYIFAQNGTYYFPSHTFVAEEADLYFFTLAGHTLPTTWPATSPFLKGSVTEVVLTANSGIPSFTAYHLNAEFDQSR
jgi:hypothetical protein